MMTPKQPAAPQTNGHDEPQPANGNGSAESHTKGTAGTGRLIEEADRFVSV